MARTTVLLADDNASFRKVVMDILSAHEAIMVIGEAEDGQNAIQRVRELRPDVVLMDLHMPTIGGLAAIKALEAEVPNSKILVLTVSDKEADLFEAMRHGARGYILKNIASNELRRAILRVAAGGVIFSAEMAKFLLVNFTEEDRSQGKYGEASFTGQETQMLSLIAQGAKNQEVANAMAISQVTFDNVMGNILHAFQGLR